VYGGINDFTGGYQPRSNLVKNENGYLLAGSHNISNRWENYFSHLPNVHRVSDVRQIEIYTTEPLIPVPSPFQVEIAIAKLKRYKSPGSDQIPAGDETLWSEIHKLINSIWKREELPDQWKESLLYQFTRRVTKLTVVIIGGYHCCQLHTEFYPISFFQGGGTWFKVKSING
jgi:hypothetical protein